MATIPTANIPDGWHFSDVTLNGFGTYRQFFRYALSTYSVVFANQPYNG